MAETTTPNNGWIKLHRKIFDNPMYFSEPFTRMQAWIDLLLLANHSGQYFYIRGNRIDVKRGEVAHSMESLAQRWKWSRGKVLRYISQLENSQMIVQQKSHVITKLSITNYNTYQSDGTTDSTTDGQQTVQQTDTNKNVKNDKNENNTSTPSTKQPKKESESKQDWKKSFEEYKNQVRKAFIEVIQDKTWMQKQQEYYPNINIKKSLEKACFNYWATEAGWQNKRSKKIKAINWKTTFGNALAMKENHVYNDKFSFNNEKNTAPGIEI